MKSGALKVYMGIHCGSLAKSWDEYGHDKTLHGLVGIACCISCSVKSQNSISVGAERPHEALQEFTLDVRKAIPLNWGAHLNVKSMF